MSTVEPASSDGMLEECVDELDGAMIPLARFPEHVLALALRVHLGNLLRVLLEREQCTREEVAEFLAGLESEAIPISDE